MYKDLGPADRCTLRGIYKALAESDHARLRELAASAPHLCAEILNLLLVALTCARLRNDEVGVPLRSEDEFNAWIAFQLTKPTTVDEFSTMAAQYPHLEKWLIEDVHFQIVVEYLFADDFVDDFSGLGFLGRTGLFYNSPRALNLG